MKISIITVSYNCVDIIERAIKSIVSQEYANLEYIVVDGGSTDGTVDVIKKYEDKITKWISEPDSGISNAFNKGIALCTGDVIGIISSDDGLLPGALNAVADAFSPDVDVYRGKTLLWKEDSDTKVVENPSMHFTYTGHDNIGHQSTFVSASAYGKYGMFDEKCKYAMDYDLLLRYEKTGAKFKYIDEILAFYSLGGITFSRYSKEKEAEFVYILEKNGATKLDIVKFKLIKRMKLLVGKFIPKEVLMKIKNGAGSNVNV